MNRLSNFNCFGLVIHGFGREEIINRIKVSEGRGVHIWIVTANPEILLTAKYNAGYWQALHIADLRIVDGFGLQLAGWLKGASPQRQSGVELAEILLERAARKNQKIVFLGGQAGAADKSSWIMRDKYPNLKISAIQGGLISPSGEGDPTMDATMRDLQSEAPDILFVAFGHPKQEEWIAKNMDKLPSVKIFMGVGGAFDFWSGKIKRAPIFLRACGLEWLWRLYKQPGRWRRIFNAVVVFPIEILREHLGKGGK
ncbi:WecB/TagA/CpsF family glycosyltransferase [Patescibacteria group bacterium]|nr:WecB/TagA/CpsF family glycosyltransferase [Patescibacteria group bacterium]MBU1629681.1 WecB/TagA/CpsF family glycosyltransferase [Patescibacteria group bacterium]MBU1907903.1 WecB/TagA/CpsF family glycosyltransferase [Patescibacteria group bacterium]